MGFALANDFGMRFKQTEHFVGHVRIALPDSFLGLEDDFLHQRHKLSQLAHLPSHRQHTPYDFQFPLLPFLQNEKRSHAGVPESSTR